MGRTFLVWGSVLGAIGVGMIAGRADASQNAARVPTNESSSDEDVASKETVHDETVHDEKVENVQETESNGLVPPGSRDEVTSLHREGASPAADDEQAPPGPAGTTLDACMNAHEQAQLTRLRGRLVEARAQLELCSQSSCPRLLTDDCRAWAVEVENETPQLRVEVKRQGKAVREARIFLDEELLDVAVLGEPFPVDPGVHRLEIELPDGARRERWFDVREGEKSVLLQIEWSSKQPIVESSQAGEPAPPKSESSVRHAARSQRVAGYALSSVAVVATGLFVGFGWDAMSTRQAAQDECEPLCSDEVTQHIRRSAAIADVSLGIAIVSTAGALISFVSSASKGREKATARPPHRSQWAFLPRSRGAQIYWRTSL